MIELLSDKLNAPILSEYGEKVCQLWKLHNKYKSFRTEQSVIISTDEFRYYIETRFLSDGFINKCIQKISMLESEIIDFYISVDEDCYISEPIIAVVFSKVNVHNTIIKIYERWFDIKSLTFRTVHKLSPTQTYPAIIVQPHRDDEQITLTRNQKTGALFSENDGENSVLCTSKRLSPYEMDMIKCIDRISDKAYRIAYFLNKTNMTIVVRRLDDYNMTREAFLSVLFEKMKYGVITQKQAIEQLKPEDISLFTEYVFDADLKYEGFNVSQRATCGKAVFPWTDDRLITDSSIMLACEVHSELLDKLKKCCGAIFSRSGGYTSHEAVICNGLGIPCITGAYDLMINESKNIAYTSKEEINQGDVICFQNNNWGKTEQVFWEPKYKLACSENKIKQIEELVSFFSDTNVLKKYPLEFQFHIAKLIRALHNVGYGK